MSFHTTYHGIGRRELEGRCAAAEHELEQLRRDNRRLTFALTARQRALARIIAGADATSLSSSLEFSDGTGDADAIAERNRAELEYSKLFESGAVTWRVLTSKAVAEAFAERRSDALAAALIRVAVVVIKWLETLDEAGA